MTTADQRLQMIIGSFAFQVAGLSAQLEEAQARVKELEAEKDKPPAEKPAE